MGMLLRRYHKTENPTVEETTDTDTSILKYLITAETQRVLNIINCETLPTELEHVIVHRVVGAYLHTNIVALVGAENLDVPTQIKMGDTQIFANYGEGELTCFRRLKW